MPPFNDVTRRASQQHALITHRQVRALGVPSSTLDRWVGTERLHRVFHSVYRVAGAPVTWEQRLLGAVLAGGEGALASHRSAARLWGVHDDGTLEITVPRRQRPRLPGVVVHRSLDVAGAHPVRRKGIPTTTPMRMLVDLGGVVDRWTVEDALDRALAQRLLSVEGVERALIRLARPGRSGAGVLRQVLDERALGADRPDGLLEPRMARLLRAHGLPAAVFQFEIWHDGRLVARVDFAFPDFRVVIEVDGFGAHSSPRALQADLQRQNRLVALGWLVLRFTWADVVRRPERVAKQVAELLGTRSPA